MKKILLLLANGFEAVEASVFTDVLGWNRFEGDGSTLVVTAGIHDKIKCTWNFTVIPEINIKDVKVDDFNTLALPIGKSGILKGRHATTYNLNNRLRQKQLSEFGANVLKGKPIVIDKNIITSYNTSTAFDVAFTLLEMLTSSENCMKVKNLIGFNNSIEK